MSQFGHLYSQYYDLLYQDKDYIGEVEYSNKVSFCKDENGILDIRIGE